MFLLFDSEVQSASQGSNKLGTGVGPVEGIALEILGTMVLCLVVLYAVAFIKGSGKQGIVAGAALFVLIMILGPISGGSLNPVRSPGPAIFSGYLDGVYVYLIGPILGAAIAGVGVSHISPPLAEVLTIPLSAMAATVFTGVVARKGRELDGAVRRTEAREMGRRFSRHG